jgi:hypothetical protein
MKAKKNSHYVTLGVPPSASADDIKHAYRRKAKQLHPDTGGSHAVAEAFHQAIQAVVQGHNPNRVLDLARQCLQDILDRQEASIQQGNATIARLRKKHSQLFWKGKAQGENLAHAVIDQIIANTDTGMEQVRQKRAVICIAIERLGDYQEAVELEAPTKMIFTLYGSFGVR